MQTQTLAYQTNYMEAVYGQNCGSYSVRVTPTLPFFSMSSSGNIRDSNGNEYQDTGTLYPGKNEDVGRY